MSSKSGRGSSRGTMQKGLMAVGVVVALLLAGNLVMELRGGGDEDGAEPAGFLTEVLTPDRMKAYGFWIPVGIGFVLCLMGTLWASKAYRESERSSDRWLRVGLVFGVAGLAAFSVAAMDPTFDRSTLAVAAAWIYGVQIALLSWTAWKANRGAAGRSQSRSRGRRRRVAPPGGSHGTTGAPNPDDDA